MTKTDTPLPRRRKRRFRLAALLLVPIAAGGALVGYNYLAEADAPQFRTETVALGSIERTVTAVGSLQPRDYVDVGTQVSGQLKKLYVAIGDEVKAGDLLAEIDSTVYQTSVASNRGKIAELEAQRAQLEAELALSKIQLERTKGLAEKQVSTKDALDTAMSTVAVNTAKIAAVSAQLDQARSALKAAEANLSYTKIYAPLTGTVVSQSAFVGQTLNANQTAPVIVRIADLKTMTVEAQVVEADVVRVKVGMEAYFSTLGLPDRRWSGKVRQVLPTPEIINDVVLYKVLVDVANSDGVLLPDMSAQVSFLEGRAENVPTVPLAALRNANGRSMIRVLTERGVEAREVELGLANRTEAEVKSGLSVGDKVVTGIVSGSATAAAPEANRRRGPGRFGPAL